MRLDDLLAMPVDGRTKGFPPAAGELRLGEIGALGWNLLEGDVPLPAATLRRSALAHNSRWMRSFLELSGALICPHGKTTMAPQLFDLQLKDGAWGITLSTLHQMVVGRRFGVQRILLANQLVDQHAIRFVLEELRRDPGFDFYALVDSVELVERLSAFARAHPPGRPLQLLLEGGHANGRTGCRTREQALAVARAVKAAEPHLALHGVEGFEGSIRQPTPEATERAVADFIDLLAAIALDVAEHDLFAPGPILLSAGGSAFFDMVLKGLGGLGLEREARLVIRSGCYLTHDSMSYVRHFEALRRRTPEAERLGEGLRPGIALFAHVQSTPEPGRVIAALGRRDVSFDVDLPRLESWYRPGLHTEPQALGDGFRVVALNDQHAYLDVPEGSPLRVGDVLSFGISHPCTTFDKWRLLYVIDDQHRIVDAVATFF